MFSVHSPCRPGPALAEPLGPNPLRLSERHHQEAPHPDVQLVEPAADAPVPLRVSGSVSNTPIVLEAVWDSEVTVAADEAWNEGDASTTTQSCSRQEITKQKS